MKVINIGLAGYGTVGSHVCKILENRRKYLENTLDCKIRIRKILVKNKKDRKIPKNSELVYDYKELLTDDINCIIELIGGQHTADSLIMDALYHNKSVITANKKLVSYYMTHMNEPFLINTSQFAFEAAVAGGIPIIKSLKTDYEGDNIHKCIGILNGTTNFMLSNMEKNNMSYENVLQIAQEKGFAEADPTADVGGFDALAKLTILIRLSFGYIMSEDSIPIKGIENITSDDFSYAKTLNSTIKLLGVAKLNEIKETDQDFKHELIAYVMPAIVSKDNVIANISDATNIVNIGSDNLGDTYYVGQGAGGYPTANSVINDLVSVIQEQSPTNTSFGNKNNQYNIVYNKDFSSKFYIRINMCDTVGIISNIGDICRINNISIYSILQNPIEDPNNCVFIVVTDTCKLSHIQKCTREISHLNWCLNTPFFMPIL